MWIQETVGGDFEMQYHGDDQVAAQKGSWSYDRDTLTEIAKEWRAMEDDCKVARGASESFAKVLPPGKEYVSERVTNRINDSNGDYLRMLDEMRVYAGAQAEACEKALGTYEETEDERSSFFSNLFADIENTQRESGGLL